MNFLNPLFLFGLGAVTVGFLSYMAIDGLPPGWELSMKSKSAEPDDAPPAGDPWNLWVFRLSGGGSVEAQEATRQTEWRGSAAGRRRAGRPRSRRVED